ncbi:MAG: glycosyltransferase family 4 protein [Bacteroidaceae bacterium]|nr:glycosyltransferase family 4 protein [Bacteroidaceae bacterium]
MKENKHYNFVYLTNTPSFYKVNLCNEIAKTHSLLLVLYGYGSEAVNKDMSKSSSYKFDVAFLHEGDSHKRNKVKTFFRLISLMRTITFDKVLYAGWETMEYNIYSFFIPRKKNVVICESTIWESKFNGLKGWVKKRIINRMGAALPSGQPHKELFTSINFNGTINVTGSVGIMNKGERKETEPNTPIRYIYVGRLIDLKNVRMLVETFNKNGKPLTIAGQGVLEEELKAKANSNITFTGFIDNEKLGKLYQAHDVFILPSYYEAWGLVVEEALYWGLPVIVSNKIGSYPDMVEAYKSGEIFQLSNKDGLEKAIEKIENNYNEYKKNVMSIDWTERDMTQIRAYTSLFK